MDRMCKTRWIAAGLLTGFLLLLQGLNELQAQDVQWATRVQGFSSQAGQSAYSAKQVLGEPNKFPALGDAPVAWSPHFEDASDERYIKVGFQKPMTIQQVMVAESNQGGCVQRIILFDRNQKEYIVYEADKNEDQLDGRLLAVTFKETRFPVYSVKVVMKNRNTWDRDQIDAIGIANTTEPWVPKIAPTERFVVQGKATPLPGSVNSAYSEIMPRLDPKSNRLYFCRKNHPDNYGFRPNDDIWYAEQDPDGGWTTAQNLGWPLNDENHNYVCTVSEDGQMLTLGNGYRFDRKPLPGVSQSLLSGNAWVEPLNLKIEGLSILNMNAEYYLSHNRKVLILAMESWDSQGGKDLYVSFSDDMINFSKPVSMGANINSAGKEMAPFLSDDGLHLFFSSDGFAGYGSHDIFVAERQDETWTSWSKPENMGPAVNSPAWDSYFYYHEGSGQAFLASNRDAFSNEDLYFLKLSEKAPDQIPVTGSEQVAGLDKMAGVSLEPAGAAEQRAIVEGFNALVEQPEAPKAIPALMLFGSVYDAVSKSPIPATLAFSGTGNAETDVKLETDKAPYKIGVEAGRRMTVEVSAAGYFAEKVNLLTQDQGQGSMRQDFELIPIREGQTISLNNIYFDVNSAVLQEPSYESLDRWVELLKQQSGVVIQVQGHTNNRCSPKYCLELSQKRAKAVSDYLQSHGISETRLRFRGFGSELPVANNDEDDGRARNQRVELKILKVN
jgi:outer membrane protein OmpA-like peptidoglycan-associated protein